MPVSVRRDGSKDEEDDGAPTEQRALRSYARAADLPVPRVSDILLAGADVCRHRPMPFEGCALAVKKPGTLMGTLQVKHQKRMRRDMAQMHVI